MQAAPIPQDEATRLETLQKLKILDTEAEERFDRVTRLAKRLFDVPIVSISLIDKNRQWFKSSIGLRDRQTPRDVSFCGHAILGDNILVIPDAKDDPRFSDNPLVTDSPYIRFYAGHPLKIGPGSAMGTICLIDQAPRDFGSEDVEALRDLATMVEKELVALQIAIMDELTQIANRRGFAMLGQHVLNVLSRFDRAALLLTFDLDGFKEINDTLGHAAGDQALKDFARILETTFREADIVARLGGDEFVVLLADNGPDQQGAILSRIEKAVSDHNQTGGRAYKIRFSVGSQSFDPKRHNSIDALLSDADALMYESKKARKLKHIAA